MAIDDQIDLMTEEEMDLGTDPEFQDALEGAKASLAHQVQFSKHCHSRSHCSS